MGRGALARLLGVEAALGGVLVALAGSDWPPPRGFWVVVVASVTLGLLVAALVPVVLRRADRVGPLPALLVAAAAGAGYLGSAAVLLMVTSPGDPSSPGPGVADRLVLLIVAACVGWFGGAAVAAVALLADRARDRPLRTLLLVVLLPVIVVGLALAVALIG